MGRLYCPRDLVGRDTSRRTLAPHSREDGELFRFGLQAFLDEARTLAKFDHANVARVRDFFETHGTAYLVMDYYEGESLLEHLRREGGKLPWRAALELMLPVLDGLREVHRRGFLHRDVKPQNIYLTTQGRPILLDFGSARQAMGERSRSLSVVLTEGYAPFEQYQRRGQQGPWTDIYSAAATLYALLTCQVPPPAPERIRSDELLPPRRWTPDLPPALDTVLLHALAVEPVQRPQTMDAFEQQLRAVLAGKQPPRIPSPASGKPNAGTVATPQPTRSGYGESKRLIALTVFLGLTGIILFAVWTNRKPESASDPSQPSAISSILPIQSAQKPLRSETEQWVVLGKAYYAGQGVPKDLDQALQWFRQAAERGHAEAQAWLGVMYVNGEGVPRDRAEAALWFRQAAERGDVSAQFNLGVMAMSGEGVPRDDAAAADWLRKAAEQGFAGAQLQLGSLYYQGHGVPQDGAEAARWFHLAAGQGIASAQQILGALYYHGRGVPQNDAQAAFWSFKAAEQGDVHAQYNLGALYAQGRGVLQDRSQAVYWFRKAAEQGDRDALKVLQQLGYR